jgi:hypothetical protein
MSLLPQARETATLMTAWRLLLTGSWSMTIAGKPGTACAGRASQGRARR